MLIQPLMGAGDTACWWFDVNY